MTGKLKAPEQFSSRSGPSPLHEPQRRSRPHNEGANQRRPIRSDVAPAWAGGKFILVKNDAQAFVGKIHRIGDLAIPGAWEDKLDDTFSTNCFDCIARAILCPACLTFGALHGFCDDCQQGFDFPSGMAANVAP